jgi:two-component system invasion response regulator UvrY
MNHALHGVRVLLADDHAIVRLGFRLLLEGAGAVVVGEAGTAKTPSASAPKRRPTSS